MKENYGFRSTRGAPADDALKGFEEDLFGILGRLEERRNNNVVQIKIREDLEKLKGVDRVLVKSDKTNNWYQLEPGEYRKQLRNLITQDYRLAEEEQVDNIDFQAAELARKLGIEDRVERLALEPAQVRVKDHKPNFPEVISYRLITPTKPQMQKVSKVILERVNVELRAKMGLQQWASSKETLDWYKDLLPRSRRGTRFIQFDIADFYGSIKKDLLLRALEWARQETFLEELGIKVILHARRNVLLDGEQCWVKKESKDFDIGQGNFDGAECSDLVGLFMLHQVVVVHKVLPKEDLGLYRDDVLGATAGGGPKIEREKKKIMEIFKEQGLVLTTEATSRRVHFLDFVMDLDSRTHQPFSKPNTNVVYVDRRSNHPPAVLKSLPKGVETRLVSLSSNVECFNQEKQKFQKALEDAGYSHTLRMEPGEEHQRQRKQRGRKILWFNPPYSMSIKNNLGKFFLGLIGKHFATGTLEGKLFNRGNLKLSYSCCPKMSARVAGHNRRILKGAEEADTPASCNCRDKEKCPMAGKEPCNVGSAVYRAEISSEGEVNKFYLGSSKDFKGRWARHAQSFRDRRLEKDTGLSEEMWRRKDKGQAPKVVFKVVKRISTYTPELGKCGLCRAEKLELVGALGQPGCLNRRGEMMGHCRHRGKFLLENVGSRRGRQGVG